MGSRVDNKKEELTEDIIDSLMQKQGILEEPKKERNNSNDDDDDDDDDDNSSTNSSILEEIPSSISREQVMNQLKAEENAIKQQSYSQTKKTKKNKVNIEYNDNKKDDDINNNDQIKDDDDDDHLSDSFLKQVDDEKKNI